MTSNGELTYFIRLNSFVKIGKTTHLKAKIDTLQHASPYELELLGVTLIPEDELHDKFDHLRERGEWFHLTHELKDFILSEISRPQTETPSPQPERIESIRDIVRELERDSGSAHTDVIVEKASKLGYTEEQTKVELSRLVQEAAIFEPVRYSQHWRLTQQ